MGSVGFDQYVHRYRRREIVVRDANGKTYVVTRTKRPSRRDAVAAAVLLVRQQFGLTAA
jgi:hypothetical protein